jgi:hypothetical protein
MKICLLEEPNCKGNCGRCGWNQDEAERREREIAENGLTPCEDGLERLIIKREG